MANIEVKQVRSTMTLDNKEPHWEVVVDYGAFAGTVAIPLPARCLITDDPATQIRQSVEAMESLAQALLLFADHTRKQWPQSGAASRKDNVAIHVVRDMKVAPAGKPLEEGPNCFPDMLGNALEDFVRAGRVARDHDIDADGLRGCLRDLRESGISILPRRTFDRRHDDVLGIGE